MKKILFFLFILFTNFIVFSQNRYNPLYPPNTYQNADNPNYWKNKLPHPGYWQQDVHYRISANINEITNIINGKEILTYYNNSPDNLHFVYFHLYQNAFQPGSYYDELQKQNKVKPKYGKYESQGKGTEIISLKVNGEHTQTELDNTILKVYLNEPILSGESIQFEINFKTYFGSGNVRRRMKKFNSSGYKHFDGVHWYPRISVYDKKFGWTTDQHLGREFYGDFGTFDVELTFASNYIVEATGFLQNRKEMLPDDLRKQLDVKKFKDKPYNSPPSVIIEYDPKERKTWKYHAENVHDFAFTADPTYRIGEAEWNGIKCYSLVQESHASKWQNAADYTAKTIRVFSEDIGMYTYHKMIVADARDGMEYPMITLDGGSDPGYRDLLVHEIGHNWFFGQIGNNETYRASLDEGFTQFLTAWGLEKIDGIYLVEEEPSGWYKRKFKKPVKARDSEIYFGYMLDATKNETPKLNTHSDGFNGALRHGGGYRHVYYKPAAMLYNLEYVLGDELFLKAMQHYFSQWKIAHPYFNDFRNSIINYTGVDLNWFFDQWLESTKDINYSISNVSKEKKQADTYNITFKRNGEMQMPIDFEVIDKNNNNYKYHIPNQWFVKKTNATILKKWHAWDKLYPAYTATIQVPNGIKEVKIDPSNRLADSYMLDNSSKFPLRVSFDSRIWNYTDWTKYDLFIRPDIWYNSYDGFKLGFHVNGNYLYEHHIFDANIWYNTGLLQNINYNDNINKDKHDTYSFRLNYRTGINKIMKKSNLYFSAKYLDGLESFHIGIDKEDRSGKNLFYLNFNSIYRSDTNSLNYLILNNSSYNIWNSDHRNNTLTIGAKHSYKYFKGKGELNISLKSSSFNSDYNYSQFNITSINRTNIHKFVLKSRVFYQIGKGSNPAPESQLYLASANPEDLMENKFTRSNGFIPASWLGYGSIFGHFHYGGGMNLRAYNGYLNPEITKNGDTINAFKGNSGASLNLELEFNKYINFLNKIGLNSYLFADIGIMNIAKPNTEIDLGKMRADAGVGFTFTNKNWGPLEMVKPLTIRIDFPFFVNRLPANSNQGYFDFRWLIGINRSF